MGDKYFKEVRVFFKTKTNYTIQPIMFRKPPDGPSTYFPNYLDFGGKVFVLVNYRPNTGSVVYEEIANSDLLEDPLYD